MVAIVEKIMCDRPQIHIVDFEGMPCSVVIWKHSESTV
jgi:hypothetical protein